MPHDIFQRNVPGTTEILQRATVGVAGCGGLGSNAAVALVRAGVGRLVLADFDKVEPSNLNRQHYFQADLGRPKVAALADHLRAIRPEIGLALHEIELAPDNVARIFSACDLLVEAFDRAERKVWLIQSWCAAFPDRPVVSGNGLSGIGRHDALRVRSAGNIHFCGDGSSDMREGLCAARVAIAANMEAHVALELLVRGRLT